MPSAFLKRILGIRVRLTILFVFIFGTVSFLFSFLVFSFLSGELQNEFDDALYNYAIDVSDSVKYKKGDLSVDPLIVDQEKIFPFSLGTAVIQVRHIDGKILEKVGDWGEMDPPYRGDFNRFHNGEEAVYRTIENFRIPSREANSYRLINFPIDDTKKTTLMLQIAVPMTLFESQIANFRNLLFFGFPFVILLSVVAGYLFTSRALAPVNQIIKSAKDIRPSELSKRLPIPKVDDEIGELAKTLNEMLERMEIAFQSQERFIADASHQLMSPLTILRGQLESFSRTSDTTTQKIAYSLLPEVDKLANIVKDMLLLARIDAGLGALNMEKLHLEDLLMEALERLEKFSSQKNIRLNINISGIEDSTTERPAVLGDRDLLLNLILNLVENAFKYSPKDGMVHAQIQWDKSAAILSITDNGPGIPADQLQSIFGRFNRGTFASHKTPGFGLGLAIAQKIASLHGASLTAANSTQGPGAVFQLKIKKI